MFARFTTPPDATRKGLINAMIVALKAGGVWSKLDFLHVYAAADSQAARQNWKGDFANATAVGGPTFTADRGYAGNGSSSYLDLGYNPGDGGAWGFQLNNCHQGVVSRTDVTGTQFDIGARGSSTASQTCMGARLSGDLLSSRLNSDANVTVANASSIGHFVQRRSSSTQVEAYRNGLSLGASTLGTTSFGNRNWFGCAVQTASSPSLFSTRQYAAMHGGADLTGVEVAALYTALSNYLTAIGA